MKKSALGILVLAGSLMGASPAPPVATAPATIDISKVSCSDLIKADALDRAAVVKFYWGYDAAKAGVSTFKTGVLQSATEHLMGVCQKNPSQTMFDAMRATNIKAF